MDNTFKVFVYGTLKQGGRFDMSDKAVSVKKGTLMGHCLWQGRFPFITVEHKDDTVYGEVHEYNIKHLDTLDRIEGYPNLYNRKEVEVSVGSGWMVKAVVYFTEDEWVTKGATLIEDGNFKIGG